MSAAPSESVVPLATEIAAVLFDAPSAVVESALSVPAVTVTVPVNVFAPESVAAYPAPVFEKLITPLFGLEMTLEKVTGPLFVATLKVAVTAFAVCTAFENVTSVPATEVSLLTIVVGDMSP